MQDFIFWMHARIWHHWCLLFNQEWASQIQSNEGYLSCQLLADTLHQLLLFCTDFASVATTIELRDRQLLQTSRDRKKQRNVSYICICLVWDTELIKREFQLLLSPHYHQCELLRTICTQQTKRRNPEQHEPFARQTSYEAEKWVRYVMF
jgi:hypothetical protein